MDKPASRFFSLVEIVPAVNQTRREFRNAKEFLVEQRCFPPIVRFPITVNGDLRDVISQEYEGCLDDDIMWVTRHLPGQIAGGYSFIFPKQILQTNLECATMIVGVN